MTDCHDGFLSLNNAELLVGCRETFYKLLAVLAGVGGLSEPIDTFKMAVQSGADSLRGL
jgi:hypothetical protein